MFLIDFELIKILGKNASFENLFIGIRNFSYAFEYKHVQKIFGQKFGNFDSEKSENFYTMNNRWKIYLPHCQMLVEFSLSILVR